MSYNHVWPSFVLTLYYLIQFNAVCGFHHVFTWHWQYIQCPEQFSTGRLSYNITV